MDRLKQVRRQILATAGVGAATVLTGIGACILSVPQAIAQNAPSAIAPPGSLPQKQAPVLGRPAQVRPVSGLAGSSLVKGQAQTPVAPGQAQVPTGPASVQSRALPQERMPAGTVGQAQRPPTKMAQKQVLGLPAQQQGPGQPAQQQGSAQAPPQYQAPRQ